MADQLLLNRKFNQDLQNGLAALEKQDFNAYMQVLINLGVVMQDRLGITSAAISEYLVTKKESAKIEEGERKEDLATADVTFLGQYKAAKGADEVAGTTDKLSLIVRQNVANAVRGQQEITAIQKSACEVFEAVWKDKEIEDAWQQKKNRGSKGRRSQKGHYI